MKHQYVDFGKLLPKDKILSEEDKRMQLVNKDGMSYWVPLGDNIPNGGITNFSKWEIAFRVFSNVYSTHYPHKAAELLQYRHVIHTAAQTYIWEICIHLSKHPQRSWSIILQQTWHLRLKDKLKYDNFNDKGKAPKSKEACKQFNRGKCNLGLACRYEHRCLGCRKFGHGEHICRKKKHQAGD